jgi:hypothetical protein
MLYKAGTVKEMKQIIGKSPNLPEEVCREALRLAKILDDVYGADRDVDKDDGGFVLIAENIQDIALINREHIDMDRNTYETVTILKCEKEPYINVFFLCNNEFGINILMPMIITPSQVLDGIKERG